MRAGRVGLIALILGLVALVGDVVHAADEPKQMTIFVTDAATSTALPNVRIRWYAYGSGASGQQRGDLVTDAEGSATIPLPAEQSRMFQMQFSLNNYVPMRANWPARGEQGEAQGDAAPPSTFDLVMEPTHAIGGKIVDDAGLPIAGASVVFSVTKKLANPNTQFDISWKTVKTKADGTWTFDNAPSSFDKARIGAYHTQYSNSPEGFYQMTEFEPVKDLLDKTAVTTLPKGVPVEGIVYGPDDKPLPGAKVGWGTDRVASNVLPEVTTDQNGKFTFGAQPDITATLTVKAKGMAPDLKRVVIGKEKTPVEFRLKPGKTITGRIAGPDGKPVAGAYLYVDTWRGARTINQQIRVDGDGKFTWKEAPEDEVLVDISGEGFAAKRRVPIKPSDQEVVINVQNGTSVHGKVIDAETGKPIEKFRITQGIQFDEQRAPSWMGYNSQAGANGDFKLTMREPYPAYVVRIDADGYKRSVSRVFKNDEPNVELEFKLVKGKSITGIVKGVDGNPIAGAVVTVATPSQVASLGGQNYGDQGSDKATTDESGKYSIPEQVDPYALVVVSDNGYAEVSQKEVEKSADIQLKAWAKIEGVLKIAGKVAADENVALGRNDFINEETPRVFFNSNAKTDGEGKFTFNRVPAGNIMVMRNIMRKHGQYTTSSPTNMERVVLKPGESVNVALGGKGRPVTGKINLDKDKLAGRLWIVPDASINTPMSEFNAKFEEMMKDKTPEQYQAWFKEWSKTDEGKKMMEDQRKAVDSMVRIGFIVEADGSFRAEDIPAGKWDLRISISQQQNNDMWGNALAVVTKTFTIDEMPKGRSDEVLDLGTLEPKWTDPKEPRR